MGEYVILSLKHTGSIASWWGSNRCGYTNNLEAAGRYTLKQADEICSPGDYQDSIPIPVSAAYIELLSRKIVDLGDAGNRPLITRWQKEAKEGRRG